jgi:hypothetical protein
MYWHHQSSYSMGLELTGFCIRLIEIMLYILPLLVKNKSHEGGTSVCLFLGQLAWLLTLPLPLPQVSRKRNSLILYYRQIC